MVIDAVVLVLKVKSAIRNFTCKNGRKKKYAPNACKYSCESASGGVDSGWKLSSNVLGMESTGFDVESLDASFVFSWFVSMIFHGSGSTILYKYTSACNIWHLRDSTCMCMNTNASSKSYECMNQILMNIFEKYFENGAALAYHSPRQSIVLTDAEANFVVCEVSIFCWIITIVHGDISFWKFTYLRNLHLF